MRLPSPSSFGYLRYRLSGFDLFWAAITPLIALYLRDAYFLTFALAGKVALYCSVTFACSIIAFLAFRLSDSMSRFFSVHDALNVVKAAVASQLLAGLVLFSATRLDGVPRSGPVVHLLVLAAGLLAARVVLMLKNSERRVAAAPNHLAIEHVILIGSTNLASLYIKLLRSYSAGRRRVVAVLDSDPKLIGRAIAGVPIIAPPQNLDAAIDEFVVHGVRIDRIIIGGDRDLLSEGTLQDIRRVCGRRNLDIDFVTQLVGLDDFPTLQSQSGPVVQMVQRRRPTVNLQPYFQFKRLIDFLGALTAIIVLSPLYLLTALIVLIDVGAPVLFWQQRTGQGACSFLLYKFRTLRAPFDLYGNRIPEDRRLSFLGAMLRRLRLDELPQLFNVLVGDMSLIGPRPLLPIDQPSNSSLRLTVRPGITGWAQVNGGNLIEAEEKGALDEWYVRNASLWFDLRIIGLTLWFFVTGEKRSEHAVTAAQAAQNSVLWENPQHRRKFRDAVTGRHSDATVLRVKARAESKVMPRQ